MGKALLFFVLAALAAGYVVVSWVEPERLPESVRPTAMGLEITFEQTYALWDAELGNDRPDVALAWTDEFLMATNGGGDYAGDALGMRQLAVSRGGNGPANWEDRPADWRYERVASRRPLQEWCAAGAAVVFLLLGAVFFMMRVVKGRAPERESSGVARPRGATWGNETLGGLIMMIVAVVWFFGAMSQGIIFFYPPVMFLLGLCAFCKGLFS
ncbi:hypothetical protein OAX78_02055 [Planctomycetota bacterium]|nr:hypothetical protein [Planctomycetota bacterium]